MREQIKLLQQAIIDQLLSGNFAVVNCTANVITVVVDGYKFAFWMNGKYFSTYEHAFVSDNFMNLQCEGKIPLFIKLLEAQEEALAATVLEQKHKEFEEIANQISSIEEGRYIVRYGDNLADETTPFHKFGDALVYMRMLRHEMIFSSDEICLYDRLLNTKRFAHELDI